MDMFPGVERLVVAELGRTMIDSGPRGRSAFLSLVKRTTEYTLVEGRADLVFHFCVPALTSHYRRVGMRPFGGRSVAHDTGLSVPMVLFPWDLRYLRRVRSPLTAMCPELTRIAREKAFDLSPFRHLLDGDRATVEIDPARVAEQVGEELRHHGAAPGVFDGLSDRSLSRLMQSGLVLRLAANDPVVHEGMVEREVYVVLEGLMAVELDGRQVALIGPGEVFGEVAFFSTSGRRTAQVRAISAGKVLVLRRRFLRELTKKDPEAGFQLLSNLSSIVADRFTERAATEGEGNQ